MDEQVDPDIGRVVGFQTGDLMYIATIISIDDDADQFTVRTEDGQELTGPMSAVFLDPEKRMDVLNERYEPLGDGKFREKPRKPRSNWTPVPDPSVRDVAMYVGGILTVAFVILLFITAVSFGAILTQIDSANWVEKQGDVVDAYEGQDCSTDSEGRTRCTSYISVTVAYKYDGQKYATQDYSMLSEDWLEDADHWLEKANVTVYVNPEEPSQAVHVQGWDGVLEELGVFFFFTGLILGGYLFVFVPVWFVYAKIQRLFGIEAAQSDWTVLLGEKETDVEPDENGGDDDSKPKNEDTPPESTIEEPAQHGAFW